MKYCSKCSKELLDEAIVCPGCGTNVEESNSAKEQPAQTPTNESTQPVVETVTQNPTVTVMQTPEKTKKKKNKIIVIISICVAVVIFVVIGLFVKFSIDKKNYEKKMNDTYGLIMSSYDKAREYCELEEKVWYNSIYERSDDETDKYTKDSNGYFNSDFNDSLQAFVNAYDFRQQTITSDANLIRSLMKEIKSNSLSSEYEQEYQILNKLYTAYSSLINLVNRSESHSYNTFSEAITNAKSDFSSAKSEASLFFIE